MGTTPRRRASRASTRHADRHPAPGWAHTFHTTGPAAAAASRRSTSRVTSGRSIILIPSPWPCAESAPATSAGQPSSPRRLAAKPHPGSQSMIRTDESPWLHRNDAARTRAESPTVPDTSLASNHSAVPIRPKSRYEPRSGCHNDASAAPRSASSPRTPGSIAPMRTTARRPVARSTYVPSAHRANLRATRGNVSDTPDLAARRVAMASAASDARRDRTPRSRRLSHFRALPERAARVSRRRRAAGRRRKFV
jgi:hypothetical protein